MPSKNKALFVDEIFGKTSGNTKFYGLVDCETEEEVARKVEQLRELWLEREGHQGSANTSFYEWFKKEKASSIFTFFGMKLLYMLMVRRLINCNNPKCVICFVDASNDRIDVKTCAH